MTIDQYETVEANAIAWIAALDLILDVWPDHEGIQRQRDDACNLRDWARTEIRNLQAAQHAIKF